MAIRLVAPVCLNELGKRKNNEDSIYPTQGSATAADRLFMVCDGVGGANKGEIASRLVCDLFADYINSHPIALLDASYLSTALQTVESQLKQYAAQHPECAGMATTLTLIYFDDERNSATLAWVGDSKIFHVRNGEILFQTTDHSLVQEWVKRGELTPEEAKSHPQRNVILRAVSPEAPTQVDVVQLNDLEKGDFFLLASDGILESVDDRILTTLLQQSDRTDQLSDIQQRVLQFCSESSNDNFSMYLLQIAEIIENALPTAVVPPSIVSEQKTELENNPTAALPTSPPPPITILDEETPSQAMAKGNAKMLRWLLIGALIAFVGFGFMYWQKMRQQRVERENSFAQAIQSATTMAENNQYPQATAVLDSLETVFPEKKATLDSLQNIYTQKEANYASQLEEQRTTDSLRIAILKKQKLYPDSTVTTPEAQSKLDSIRQLSNEQLRQLADSVLLTP